MKKDNIVKQLIDVSKPTQGHNGYAAMSMHPQQRNISEFLLDFLPKGFYVDYVMDGGGEPQEGSLILLKEKKSNREGLILIDEDNSHINEYLSPNTSFIIQVCTKVNEMSYVTIDKFELINNLVECNGIFEGVDFIEGQQPVKLENVPEVHLTREEKKEAVDKVLEELTNKRSDYFGTPVQIMSGEIHVIVVLEKLPFNEILKVKVDSNKTIIVKVDEEGKIIDTLNMDEYLQEILKKRGVVTTSNTPLFDDLENRFKLKCDEMGRIPQGIKALDYMLAYSKELQNYCFKNSYYYDVGQANTTSPLLINKAIVQVRKQIEARASGITLPLECKE